VRTLRPSCFIGAGNSAAARGISSRPNGARDCVRPHTLPLEARLYGVQAALWAEGGLKTLIAIAARAFLPHFKLATTLSRHSLSGAARSGSPWASPELS